LLFFATHNTKTQTMFGDMMGMMGKLKETTKVEDTKNA
jgi:hypothetical protein